MVVVVVVVVLFYLFLHFLIFFFFCYRETEVGYYMKGGKQVMLDPSADKYSRQKKVIINILRLSLLLLWLLIYLFIYLFFLFLL